MNQSKLTTWLCLGVVAVKMTWIRAILLYPASSVLQLTASLSVPVIDLPPQRRVGFDWGIQMNYDMPFNLSLFYNVPIWSSNQNLSKRDAESKFKQKHHFDYDLIDFYEYLTQRLESYGFHKSCLLLCICELVQNAFEWQGLHFITELLEFFASPSLLLHNETIKHSTEISPYMLAEERGVQNENCTSFYSLCERNPLNLFSKIVMD